MIAKQLNVALENDTIYAKRYINSFVTEVI